MKLQTRKILILGCFMLLAGLVLGGISRSEINGGPVAAGINGSIILVAYYVGKKNNE